VCPQDEPAIPGTKEERRRQRKRVTNKGKSLKAGRVLAELRSWVAKEMFKKIY